MLNPEVGIALTSQSAVARPQYSLFDLPPQFVPMISISADQTTQFQRGPLPQHAKQKEFERNLLCAKQGSLAPLKEDNSVRSFTEFLEHGTL